MTIQHQTFARNVRHVWRSDVHSRRLQVTAFCLFGAKPLFTYSQLNPKTDANFSKIWYTHYICDWLSFCTSNIVSVSCGVGECRDSQWHTSPTFWGSCFKILWKSLFLYFSVYCSNQVTISHMPRQLSCRGLCKLVIWFDHSFPCKGNPNFYKFSNTSSWTVWEKPPGHKERSKWYHPDPDLNPQEWLHRVVCHGRTTRSGTVIITQFWLP